MKLHTRGVVATLAIAGAALIAAGCGGSGGGGATGAAKDAAVLDLIPKDALGYVAVDTDFSGDNWKQFSDLAKAFDKDFKGVDEEIAEEASSDDEGEGDDVDFKKDVDPWLGENGGLAVLGIETDDEGDPSELLAWVELEDTAKFEDFLKDQEFKAGDKVGDYETYEDADGESFVGFNDEYAVLAMNRKQLETTLEFDGDSIKDAEGVSDSIDEVEGDALATVVISGEGLRAAAKDNAQLKAIAGSDQLKDFHAAAISFSAEDDGMRVDGHVRADGKEAGENAENALFADLPGDTVLAIGGNDLGGALKTFAEEAGKDNAQIQQGVGAITGVLGVTLDDFAKAFSGDFALAIAADDTGLGALAGGVAGAAMGGGLGSTDPSQLLKAGTVLLAFEETGEAGETLDKIAAAAGGLAGGGTPKAATSGDFETKTMTLQGIPVTTAASDDVAALSVGLDVYEAWGDETLADNDAYKAANEAADAPSEALGSIWFDAGRVAKLAGVESGEGVELGGLVGWIESDGSNGNFGLFLHVDES